LESSGEKRKQKIKYTQKVDASRRGSIWVKRGNQRLQKEKMR
jgi:hypothetical protein